MCVLTSDTGLESGLSLDEIESRLVQAAHRHHLEERNMAYWLLVWITIGGFRDLFRLFGSLRVEVVDKLDDGR